MADDVIDLTEDRAPSASKAGISVLTPTPSLINDNLPGVSRCLLHADGRNNQPSTAVDVEADDDADVVFLRTERPEQLHFPRTGYTTAVIGGGGDVGDAIDGSDQENGDRAREWLANMLRAREGRATSSVDQSDAGRVFSRDVTLPGGTFHDSAQVGPMGEAAARRAQPPSRNAAQQDSYNSMQARMRAAAHSYRGSDYHRVPPPTAQNAVVPSYRPPGNTGLYDELLADAVRDNQIAHANDQPQELAARPGGAIRGVAHYMHDGVGAIPYFAHNALHGMWNLLGFNRSHQGEGYRQGVVIAPGYHNNRYPGTAVSAADEKRRRAKKYSVRQSHPHYVRKMQGFSRDVIPPPDPDEIEEDKVSPVYEATTRQPTSTVRRSSRKGKQAASLAIETDDDNNHCVIDVPLASRKADEIIDEDEFEVEQLVSADYNRSTAAAAAAARQAPKNVTHVADVPFLDLDTEGSGTASTTSSIADTVQSTSTVATSVLDDGRASLSTEQRDDLRSVGLDLMTQPKPKTKITAAVCASCIRPLYLHQSASGRPFLLLCGHVVCHKCLNDASKRADKLANDPAILLDEQSAPGRSSWAGTPFNEAFEEVQTVAAPPEPTRGMKRKRGVTSFKAPRKIANSGRSQQRVVLKTNPPRSLHQAQAAKDPGSDHELADSAAQPSAAQVVDSESAARAPPWSGRRRPRLDNVDADDTCDDEEPLADRLRDGQDETYRPAVTETATEEKPDRTDEQSSMKGTSRTSTRAKSAKDVGIDVNLAWVTCPIVGCKGEQTDLLARIGSRHGPWEMFV